MLVTADEYVTVAEWYVNPSHELKSDRDNTCMTNVIEQDFELNSVLQPIP